MCFPSQAELVNHTPTSWKLSLLMLKGPLRLIAVFRENRDCRENRINRRNRFSRKNRISRCSTWNGPVPALDILFDGSDKTAGELLQIMKEHEIAHCNQLYLYLRSKGIVPPTTRKRAAAKAAQ